MRNMTRRDLLALPGTLAITGTSEDIAGVRPGASAAGDTRLVGTFQFDRRHSEDPQRAVAQAAVAFAPEDRSRIHRALLNRVTAPELLAIHLNGRHVTLASSSGPRVTFEAD